MIWITGDCHADFSRFLEPDIFPEQKDMTKDDYVIITGDFGGVWAQEETKEEKRVLDQLNNLPFTLLFVCGNHENFDRLYQYPVEEWHGGKVHKIRDSVLHLMRGQVFEICGKKIFTFGGASSHDIQDGILEPDDPCLQDKIMELNKRFACFRINHYSWWEKELPSDEEMKEGFINLDKHNNQVDFIISHCCPTSTQLLLSHGFYKTDVLTDYLEKVRNQCNYRYWFFGHYHVNQNVTPKDICLYEQIIRIA